MRKTKFAIRLVAVSVALFFAAELFTAASFAQAPPSYPPQELDRLVSPIALYPDPLLAQILTASTFSNDIPAAAQWADEHHYLTGDALAQAITADQLPWDPSVQALLPFPSVLDMMASDMGWTQELGDAVLAQRPDVMDAVQRLRSEAANYGYLRSNPSIIVGMGPYITIMPANPAFVVVPAYSPAIVFAAPRFGFAVGAAIRFGFGVTIGLAFRPWGWGLTRFNWGGHALIVNNVPWGRTWANRATYVHPYAVRRFAPSASRPPEQHELVKRSPREREDAKVGRAVKEEHAKAPKREKKRDEHR
jgi:hypothetical protein